MEQVKFEPEDILDPVEAIKREGLRLGKRKFDELYKGAEREFIKKEITQMQKSKRAKYTKKGLKIRRPMHLKPELKSVDTGSGSGVNVIGTTTSILLLNAITQGTDINGRVGDRVNIQSIALRFWVVNNLANGALPEDLARFIIVFDRQAQSGAPTWTNVMASTDTTGTTSNDALSYPNVTNNRRFTILRDWVIKLPATGALGIIGTTKTVDPDSPSHYREMFLKINKISEYLSGTSTAFSSGAIYFMAKSQVNAANNFSYQINARIRYLDV